MFEPFYAAAKDNKVMQHDRKWLVWRSQEGHNWTSQSIMLLSPSAFEAANEAWEMGRCPFGMLATCELGTRPHILLHSLVSLPSRGETGSSGKTEWLCRIVRKSEPVPASLVFAERSPTHELTRVYFRRGWEPFKSDMLLIALQNHHSAQ